MPVVYLLCSSRGAACFHEAVTIEGRVLFRTEVGQLVAEAVPDLEGGRWFVDARFRLLEEGSDAFKVFLGHTHDSILLMASRMVENE